MKKKIIIPTPKQKLFAKNLTDTLSNSIKSGQSEKISYGEIIKKSGYAPTMYDQPKRILSERGIIQALNDIGLTDERLSKELEKIVYQNKDLTNKNRALMTAGKWKGYETVKVEHTTTPQIVIEGDFEEVEKPQ